jgi:hypothetical protein
MIPKKIDVCCHPKRLLQTNKKKNTKRNYWVNDNKKE